MPVSDSRGRQTTHARRPIPTTMHANDKRVPTICCPVLRAGLFSAGGWGAKCEVCPAETFSDSEGSDKCEACPAGTTTTGATGATKCGECKSSTGAAVRHVNSHLVVLSGTYSSSSIHALKAPHDHLHCCRHITKQAVELLRRIRTRLSTMMRRV